MKAKREVFWLVKWKLGLVAVGLALTGGSSAVGGDVHLDMLKTRTDTYTGVTVYGRSKTDVFIRHSQGIANIKLASLDPETIAQLNGEKPPGPPGGLTASATPAAGELKGEGSTATNTATTATALASRLNARLRQQMMSSMAALKTLSAVRVSPAVVGVALGVMFLAYLFLCHCLKLICLRTGNDPGILIWLPLFQMIPLLRAAGMSGWWFLALFIPIVEIVWCFKIAKARGKSAWVGIGLLLPVINMLSLLYLAFSDGNGAESSGNQRFSVGGPLPVEA